LGEREGPGERGEGEGKGPGQRGECIPAVAKCAGRPALSKKVHLKGKFSKGGKNPRKRQFYLGVRVRCKIVGERAEGVLDLSFRGEKAGLSPPGSSTNYEGE